MLNAPNTNLRIIAKLRAPTWCRYLILSSKNDIPLKTLAKSGEEKLLSYSWPGNIRELRNSIEHAVVTSDSEILEGTHLLIEEGPAHPSSYPMTLKELEKEHILYPNKLKNWFWASAKPIFEFVWV